MIGVMSEFEWCTRSVIGVESEWGRSMKCVKCENMWVSVYGGCTNLSASIEPTSDSGIESEEIVSNAEEGTERSLRCEFRGLAGSVAEVQSRTASENRNCPKPDRSVRFYPVPVLPVL